MSAYQQGSGGSRSKGIRGSRRLLREKFAIAQAGICPLCGGNGLTADNGTLDHVVPRSRGGTGAKSNLRLTHEDCNKLRGNELVQETAR